ncbi:hypothetical protein [Polymorphospora lycopeni]|uniref:Uncharacterized protein n=1 Tax=Polymorphospora lycopeni TaxID=3140240 RepID=A0ABV5CP78_9ACTN
MIRRLLVAVPALAVGTAAAHTVQPALLPAPTRPPARCRAPGCGKPVHFDNLVDGYGPECARQRGLTVTTPRIRCDEQTGPDLFDSAREDQS